MQLVLVLVLVLVLLLIGWKTGARSLSVAIASLVSTVIWKLLYKWTKIELNFSLDLVAPFCLKKLYKRLDKKAFDRGWYGVISVCLRPFPFRRLVKFARGLLYCYASVLMTVSRYISLYLVPTCTSWRTNWLQKGAELWIKGCWKSACVNYKCTM